MRKQDRLSRMMGNGLSAATKDDVLGHAWVDPGTYSADLDNFISQESDVLPGDTSDPRSLSSDVAETVHFGNVLNDDADLGAITAHDYTAFRRAVHALAADCPPS